MSWYPIYWQESRCPRLPGGTQLVLALSARLNRQAAPLSRTELLVREATRSLWPEGVSCRSVHLDDWLHLEERSLHYAKPLHLKPSFRSKASIIVPDLSALAVRLFAELLFQQSAFRLCSTTSQVRNNMLKVPRTPKHMCPSAKHYRVSAAVAAYEPQRDAEQLYVCFQRMARQVGLSKKHPSLRRSAASGLWRTVLTVESFGWFACLVSGRTYRAIACPRDLSSHYTLKAAVLQAASTKWLVGTRLVQPMSNYTGEGCISVLWSVVCLTQSSFAHRMTCRTWE